MLPLSQTSFASTYEYDFLYLFFRDVITCFLLVVRKLHLHPLEEI